MTYVQKFAALATALVLIGGPALAGGTNQALVTFTDTLGTITGILSEHVAETRGYQSGFATGYNEGFLDTYGNMTGMTPGPHEVPFGGGGGGGGGRGGGHEDMFLSPSSEIF